MGDKLGIYIHIPFCRSKCDYCDFYSLSGREGRMDHYQKALLAHLRETAPLTQGIPVDLSLLQISEPTRQAETSYAVFCWQKNTKEHIARANSELLYKSPTLLGRIHPRPN